MTSLTFCLSKGLGAPMGSVVCGNRDFIEFLLPLRKMLGGGMRQIGIMAAAGIYALNHNAPLLKHDHIKAQQLYNAFKQSNWAIAEGLPETNMVFAKTNNPASTYIDKLKAQGLWAMAVGPNRVRMVAHIGVNDAQIERACTLIKGL
jgi:threonine aldolase